MNEHFSRLGVDVTEQPVGMCLYHDLLCDAGPSASMLDSGKYYRLWCFVFKKLHAGTRKQNYEAQLG